MTLFFEKSYDEIPLKKVAYNQSVPHIHTPASSFEFVFFPFLSIICLLHKTLSMKDNYENVRNG